MSADNYYAVYPQKDEWIVVHGFMSPQMEDCTYRGTEIARYPSRAEALLYAHDQGWSEYGVIELPELPKDFCGRCFVCVHERHFIDSTLRRCDKCGVTISDSEGVTMTQGGTFHNMCAPPISFERG